MFFSDGSSWTGVCPDCGGRFELLYGGILPKHAAAHAAEKQDAPTTQPPPA